MKKWNIGEWSEVYVLTKLLADGKVFAADSSLNKIKDIFYIILKVIRDEEGIAVYNRNKTITIENEQKEILAVIDIDKIAKLSEQILSELKADKQISIKLQTELFKTLKVKRPTARTSGKTDLSIIIHDPKTQSERDLGFSIKSYLGSNPTLFNAGKNTNIIYKVSNLPEYFDIAEVNKLNSCREIVSYILKQGGNIVYEDFQEKKFKANLGVIDGDLPKILADMVLLRYTGDERSIGELTTSLEKSNLRGYDMETNPNYYISKIKTFLFDIALGMTPSQQWAGVHDATGGYLIVKKNGEVLCYHVYNWNAFKDYLFQETFIDLPSENRHAYGKILIGENLYIKLNFQIRFKSMKRAPLQG